MSVHSDSDEGNPIRCLVVESCLIAWPQGGSAMRVLIGLILGVVVLASVGCGSEN